MARPPSALFAGTLLLAAALPGLAQTANGKPLAWSDRDRLTGGVDLDASFRNLLTLAAGFEKNEIAVDAYYRFQLTPAAYLQPEAQYIVNPSGDPAIDDALILGVRVGVTF